MSAAVLLAGAWLGVALAAEPVAPKLEALPTAPAVGDAVPGARLPSVATICIDRRAARCWTAAGTGGCEPGGEPFATVAAGADDVGARLRACWDTVRAHHP